LLGLGKKALESALADSSRLHVQTPGTNTCRLRGPTRADSGGSKKSEE